MDILYELVQVRSDTGSALEKALGEKIYDMIRNAPFFKAHPDYCGMDTFGDFLDLSLIHI